MYKLALARSFSDFTHGHWTLLWGHEGGSMCQRDPFHPMVARQQRERQEGDYILNFPLQGHVPNNLTSSEFHFLPKENSRVVPGPCLNTQAMAVVQDPTATPWEKTEWQKMFHDSQESDCFLSTFCCVTVRKNFYRRTLKFNCMFPFYFWILQWF